LVGDCECEALGSLLVVGFSSSERAIMQGSPGSVLTFSARQGASLDTVADERRYEISVQRADRREQMGGFREPERPDRSRFT